MSNSLIIESAVQVMDLCHGAAVKAGWYTDLQTGERIRRNTGEILMLAVSEVCEAFEAWESRAMDDKLPNRCGVEVELADELIRHFDTLPGLGHGDQFNEALLLLERDRVPYYGGNGSRPGEERFLGIIRHISDAMEADRKKAASRRYPSLPGLVVHVGQAVRATIGLANLLQVDLWGAIHDKVAFNATREDHKIEHRKAAGGKAYR